METGRVVCSMNNMSELIDLFTCGLLFLWTNTRKIQLDTMGMGRMVMVFSATFNNISIISWWSVSLVEETGSPEYPEKTTDLSWAVFKSTTLVVLGTDCTCSCKYNYHMISIRWSNINKVSIYTIIVLYRNMFSPCYSCKDTYLFDKPLSSVSISVSLYVMGTLYGRWFFLLFPFDRILEFFRPCVFLNSF